MRVPVFVVGLAASAMTFGFTATGQQSLADFHLVVAYDPVAEQIVLQCSKGCAWKTVTFDCRQGEPCSSPIDEFGMAWSEGD